jgi:hypothetical protein
MLPTINPDANILSRMYDFANQASKSSLAQQQAELYTPLQQTLMALQGQQANQARTKSIQNLQDALKANQEATVAIPAHAGLWSALTAKVPSDIALNQARIGQIPYQERLFSAQTNLANVNANKGQYEIGQMAQAAKMTKQIMDELNNPTGLKIDENGNPVGRAGQQAKTPSGDAYQQSSSMLPSSPTQMAGMPNAPQVQQLQSPQQQSQTFDEPAELKQDRIDNLTNRLSMVTKGGVKPNELYLKSQLQNLSDYNKQASSVQASSQAADEILSLLDKMEEERKQLSIVKGTPEAAVVAERYTDAGQKIRSDYNTLVQLEIPGLKGMGRVTNAALSLLVGAKPTTAQMDQAYQNAINNIRARALETKEYGQIFREGKNTYSNAGYGIAPPTSYIDSMFSNYKKDNPTMASDGNLNYKNIDLDKIRNYSNLPALFSAVGNKSYTPSVYTNSNGLPSGLTTDILNKLKQKYPTRSEQEILTAWRKRGS